MPTRVHVVRGAIGGGEFLLAGFARPMPGIVHMISAGRSIAKRTKASIAPEHADAQTPP